MSPSAPNRSPGRIGPYRVERELGRGGMGVVWLGREETTGELVAVKVLRPGTTGEPRLRARLRAEVAAASGVPRFCTAPVVAADLDADPPWVATEYIDGPTLSQAVAARGQLRSTELEGLAVAVALALQAIHDHGVRVHRDLKPSNILLSGMGPRVIDFGIARLDGDEHWRAEPITESGATPGTPPYMAPEQVLRLELTPKVDVFAWAAVVTFAATGQHPFGFDERTPERIVSEQPQLSGVAGPLRELVLAAFHKDPAQRPSAADLVDRLSLRNPAAANRVFVRAQVKVPAAELPDTLVENGAAAPGIPTQRVPPPAGRPLVDELAELVADRRLLAAYRLVDVPDEALPPQSRLPARYVRAQAGRALALRDQAVAAPDPDQAWQLLAEAEQYAGDLPDLAGLRGRWPPRPAGTPAARATAAGVVISWPASGSPAGPVSYRVVRAQSPFPPGQAYGEPVVITSDCEARDPSPPVNIGLHYAVVAQRGGAAAPPATTPAAVWFRPEVADLRVEAGDAVVAVAWQAPAGAGAVVVRRAADRPPAGPDDGDPVPVSGSGFTDRGVESGVRYHYLVAVAYPDPAGQEVLTPGRRFTALPVRPPEPVAELALEQLADEPGWLRARFPEPAAGQVALREVDGRPQPGPGARVAVAALPGRPVPAVPVPGGLKLAAPPAPAVLVAVTVHGDLAAVGAYQEWRPVPAPAGLRAQRRAGDVLLTWQWPAEVGVARVRWGPVGTAEPGWRGRQVTVAGYRHDGGATIRPGGAGPYEVIVMSVVDGAIQELVSPPARIVVDMPVPGSYTIGWLGLAEREVVVRVTARFRVRVPRLVLVATGGDWPLSVGAGQVVAQAWDVELGPGQPGQLRAPEPALPRPYWLRCFAPDGPVELRDPGRDQLRVG